MRERKTRSGAAESLSIDAERTAAALALLPPEARLTVVRLLEAAAARGGQLPTGMLDELTAISVTDVDFRWQIQRLQEIMERWLQNH